MQVAQAPADEGVGDFVLLADELVEIVDGLLELLVQQARHAAAVIGARQVGAQLDSLERSFNRIVVVAEHLPEISDKVLEELNRQATQLIWTMNASVDNAFADFDRQRGELQQYVTREREALVEQLRATGDELVRTTLDAVPGLVGKILLYVVLALAVLIGGPFALGFWLGGVRAKARIKNEKLKMKNPLVELK